MAGRLRALRSWAARRKLDLALSHASHELPLVARSLGIPSSYAFDYEFARAQHTLGSRAARAWSCPTRSRRIGSTGSAPTRARSAGTPASRRSTTSPASSRTRQCWTRSDVDRERVLVVVRTPPDVSLYHRHGNVLFADLLHRIGADPRAQAVVFPRTERAARRDRLARAPVARRFPSDVVDAQSLVALSDLVVSAGGTMNREAAALGVPAYTTFAGRLGAVDEQLIHEQRLRVLTSVESVQLEKRADTQRASRGEIRRCSST